jgi:hypothetical protein
MDSLNQKALLKIVRKWHPKEKPEYRYFKCGLCKRFIRKAWHIWFHDVGYNVEVHLCGNCWKKLNRNDGN